MIMGNILANAGTPLMWAAILHLLFGNFLIGIGEGVLLALLFRVKYLKAIGVMIAANYVSAWSAYWILGFFLPLLNSSITIYSIQKALWVAYGIAYLYTLIVEWPLIFYVLRLKTKPLLLSIAATILIQSISYGVLAYWYWSSSYDGLFRNAQIVHSLDFVNNKGATVYFIGQDKNIYKIGIDGSNIEKIYEPTKKQDLMKLYLEVNSDSGNADLCASLIENFHTELESDTEIVKKDILNSKQLEVVSLYDRNTDWSYEATDFRSQNQRQWCIETGFWAAEGLRFWNNQTGESIHISMETPFVQWYARDATVLPGDEVVFQFGNQVCVFSRESSKLALLSMGTSPVLIMPD